MEIWGQAEAVLTQAKTLAAAALPKGQAGVGELESGLTAASYGTSQEKAAALIALARAYLEQEDGLSDATPLAKQAVGLFKELGVGALRDVTNFKGKPGPAKILSPEESARRDAALRPLRETLLTFREIGVPEGELAVLLKAAEEQVAEGKTENAAALVQEAERVVQREGKKELETKVAAPSNLILAKADLAKKASQPALQHAAAAEKALKAAQQSAAAAEVLASEAHSLQGNFTKALEASTSAAASYKSSGDKEGEALAMLAMAQAQQGQGDKDKALQSARAALLLAHSAEKLGVVDKARLLCAELRKAAAGTVAVPAAVPCKVLDHRVPGVSGPATLPSKPFVGAQRMVGTQESKRLSGLVTLVTGASRGIGKGIAQSLAEAGAIVYVTGRSAPGKETDIILMGTVDETASTFQKLGGTGVAVHVDHAQDEQNSAIVKMIRETHGRLDILVNSAFYIPKPDMIFFTTPVWNQPMRFLNEQTSVGGLNHIGLTVEMLPFLRRGRGVVLNISSWGSQMNIPIFPLSYYCNKATFDRSMMALAEKVRNYGVCVLTVWPGSVKSERSIMGAKRSAARLIDLETTRFTGNAIVQLGSLSPEVLRVYSSKHRVLSSADVLGWEVDGYYHQGDLHTFTTGGRS
ncbi:unnamed protein product [Effrenium voratum]|uniref:Uncharacterized protein n=1 Tax=Effrenium voratum TaxID=2562239 RepID=A0AA36IN44_9DINO|nr:unnamed protein product [Effrenium voratum]CAJ1461445.1 unnamed protein product [Effrenium voratum]